ncbi:MAG: hypothetical protein HC898_04240 [Phycisphaerales bacterium]|nr:hypothetical protein [Phycisphaerales bacterium]
MNLPAHITSTTNPRIKAVVRLLREHRERRRTGLFVAEGRRQIQRALAAGLSLHELYECPTLASEASSSAPFDLPAKQQAQVVQVSEAVMRKMAYKENPESCSQCLPNPSGRCKHRLSCCNRWPIAMQLQRSRRCIW